MLKFKIAHIEYRDQAFNINDILYTEVPTWAQGTSIYKLGLSICFFVSNKRQNTEPIGLKFCVRPHVAPRKVYNYQNLNFVFKSFLFL